MRVSQLSPKQRAVVLWWKDSATKNRDALICHGAVRSGKTTAMCMGFLAWSMLSFRDTSFGLCGKTIRSLQRNLLLTFKDIANDCGMHVKEQVSKNCLEISFCGHTNRYHLFGGRDESSASLIQGITLGGVFFDEVALMPRSFVEQALARCSVAGSRFWFNCNPDTPFHWFYREWILQAVAKNALVLHFTMEDNPTLSEQMKNRYRRMYNGVFYDRFVRGIWTAADGLVYPMFSPQRHIVEDIPTCEVYYLSCDYGTVNPASFGLWGKHGNAWYRIREYYYNARETGERKTDEAYYRELEKLVGDIPIRAVICDPSAASFIECIRNHGKYRVYGAKNDVHTGIQKVSRFLEEDKLFFHRSCTACIDEFGKYRWDIGANKDKVLKEYDHAMDEMRYLIMTADALENRQDFYVGTAARTEE